MWPASESHADEPSWRDRGALFPGAPAAQSKPSMVRAPVGSTPSRGNATKINSARERETANVVNLWEEPCRNRRTG